MRDRPITGRLFSAGIGAGLAVIATAAPMHGQARAKVLTPPRGDSATRPRQTTAVPGANAPSATAPGATPAARPAPVIPQSPVLDSIREVVFHNLLARDRTGFSTLASAFCLGLSTDDFKKPTTSDRVDPPESMVRRLFTARAPARRASGCTFSGNTPPTRSVPGRALLYTVGAIDVESSRAEAAAGYNYDGYSSGGYTFSVERSDSGWVVRQWRMEWTAKP